MYFIGVSGLRVLPLLINGWMDGSFEEFADVSALEEARLMEFGP